VDSKDGAWISNYLSSTVPQPLAFRSPGPHRGTLPSMEARAGAPADHRRPVIGISAYREQAQWGVWSMPAVLVPEGYVRQVAAAGGLPIVLPPTESTSQQVLDLLDGLILAGGADLDPQLYGQVAHQETIGVRPDRDAAERALALGAMQRDLPTLGICRGMQLLAVTHGGQLEQHLPDAVHHNRHRPEPGVFGEHLVRLKINSIVQRALGDSAVVKSYHHQGVADPGSLEVTGWADDETIEVVEVPGKRFAVGVLWHPEAGDSPALFDALITAAST